MVRGLVMALILLAFHANSSDIRHEVKYFILDKSDSIPWQMDHLDLLDQAPKLLDENQAGWFVLDVFPEKSDREIVLMMFSGRSDFWLDEGLNGDVEAFVPKDGHPITNTSLQLYRKQFAEQGLMQLSNNGILPLRIPANRHLRLWVRTHQQKFSINDWRKVSLVKVKTLHFAESINIVKFVFYVGSLFIVLIVTFFLTIRSLTLGGIYFFLIGICSFIFMTGYYPFGSYLAYYFEDYLFPSVYILPMVFCFYFLFVMNFFQVKRKFLDVFIGLIIFGFSSIVVIHNFFHDFELEFAILGLMNNILIPLSIPFYVLVAILGRKGKKWIPGTGYISLGVLSSNLAGVFAMIFHGGEELSIYFGAFDPILVGYVLEHLFFAMGIIKSVEQTMQERGTRIVRFESELAQKELEKEQLRTKLLEEQQVVMEQKIEERTKQLSIANTTKNKFFSIVAHDLRSPMIALQGVGKRLEYFIDNNKQEKLLALGKKVDGSIDHLNHLLNNLLNWASSESDVLPNHPQRLSSQSLIGEVVSLYEGVARASEVEIKTIGDDFDIEADFNMASSVLRNVVSNAIKFSEKGTDIRIATSKTKDRVTISIQDQGRGISSEKLQQLFETASSDVGSRGEKGFGLGLQLAREFMERNGGSISAVANDKKGMTFIIVFEAYADG